MAPGEPIRASRRSAEWCRKAVDVCWNAKRNRIREEECGDAKQAYDEAAAIYDEIVATAVAE